MTNSTGDRRSLNVTGTGLSPGFGLGIAYRLEETTPKFFKTKILPDETDSELRRLASAFQDARKQLKEIRQRFKEELGQEHAYLIDAHLLILEDKELRGQIERGVREDLKSPELSVKDCAEGWLSVYRSLNDPFFQARGSDVEEVLQRVIMNLMKLGRRGEDSLPEELVLVVPEISLLLLAEFPLDRVKGLVITRAGVASHPVIIARSCRIPVVSGIHDLADLVNTGDDVIVNGDSGEISFRPTAAALGAARVQVIQEERLRRSGAMDDSPCLTSDGVRIHLYANAELEEEVSLGIRAGAEGIGLFRSEYLYMRNKEGPLSEAEQLSAYSRLIQSAAGRPVSIRTLDLGGEQHPYFSEFMGETGSVMGLRGIRFSLKYPEIFRQQLRAILRASPEGRLRIVLPMISSVQEVLAAKELILAAQQELCDEDTPFDEGVELGLMVEVPAAVILLESLCEHVDFVAVGTNDLTQYLLAAGREDDQVADLFDPLHPAVIRSLDQVARIASKSNCRAVICGEIASHPLYAKLLVGMGFRYLSMSAVNIQEIKRRLGDISTRTAGRLLEEVLECATLDEVRGLLEGRLQEVEPASFGSSLDS